MHAAQSSTPAPSRLRTGYLAIELLVLYFGIPLALVNGWLSIGLIASVAFLLLVTLMLLSLDHKFDRRRLWNHASALEGWRIRVVIFVIAAIALTVVTIWFAPDRLLGFVKRRPDIWLIVMIAYPVLSVYPQEILFRAFFFHRYQSLFSTPALMIAVNAVAFGFAHIIFYNWQAPVLCMIGGVLFAQTYLKTRSLLACSLDHAAYGCFVFTLGLGQYFHNFHHMGR